MSDPLVSILINNYNYGRYVSASIDSALGQTYRNVEVIVVDDGSKDDSRALIEKYAGKVKTLFKENGGQASCFNEGFALSKGEIICFLDSDDVFLPNKVEKVVEILTTGTAEWCFHNVDWADANLNLIPGTPPIGYKTGRQDFRAELSRGFCAFCPPATSGLAFSRKLLSTLLPMPEHIRITSDNYIKLSALGLAPGYFMSDPLTLQRIHGNNLYTAQKNAEQKASIALATATAIRDNFPSLRKSCNRMFVSGIVDKWKAGSSLKATFATLSDYLADLPITERSETLLRVLVRAFRQSFLSAKPC